MFGGCSGINLMGWGRASSVEYDALSAFAPNSGWTWSGLLPYLKKCENFSSTPENMNTYPGIDEQQAGQTHANPKDLYGTDGPISVGSGRSEINHRCADRLVTGFVQSFLLRCGPHDSRDPEQGRNPYERRPSECFHLFVLSVQVNKGLNVIA